MSRFRLFLALAIPLLIGCSQTLVAQSVGDHVQLISQNPQGVPVHPGDGVQSYVRWQNGTRAFIREIQNWFRVEAEDGQTGWVTRRYIFAIEETDEEETPPEDEVLTYTIGTWNLEHLRDGTRRGFPESIHGGPSYPPRADADYAQIADIITTQLDAKILILNEVNGQNTGRSEELDRLVGHLGGTWSYELGASGGHLRLAILFDGAFVRRDTCDEFTVASQEIDGKDIFARDPLACQFTLLDSNGAPQNDLIVVALHLASGQANNNNHNTAMEVLRQALHQAFTANTFPGDERDILIGGDLNASRYDSRQENFWDNYDSGGFSFTTLAPTDGTEYPGTRLAGVPLFPRSQIDYLIASTVQRGLNDELVQLTGEVHIELLAIGFDEFREHASDHIPVTVSIRVMNDTDQ